MKKFVLVVLAISIVALPALAGTKVTGHMSPRFEMIDNGEDNAKNMGFGFYNNRVVFTGDVEGGEIIKNVKFRVETDLSSNTVQGLKWAFADLYFNEKACVRMGRMKEPISREILHSTAKLLTAGRHLSGTMAGYGYGGYNYGMEFRMKEEKWSLVAGLYEGKGAQRDVENQDPCLDLGARVLFQAVEGLEVGASAMMIQLPEGGSDQGTYADTDDDSFETNSGLAIGLDFEYKKSFGESKLCLEGEFDTGDNPNAITVDDAKADGDWEDAEFEKFTYMNFFALFMINADFGIHLGYSVFDPNTETDDDATNMLTPGVTYYWSQKLWTKAEIQIIGDEIDDSDSLAHFVLQTVLLW